jgi:hypothetical protein
MAELLRGVQVHGPTTTRLTELPVLVLQANNIEDMRKANIIRTPAS